MALTRLARTMTLAVSVLVAGDSVIAELLAQAPAAPPVTEGRAGRAPQQGRGFGGGGRGGGPVVIGEPAPVPPEVAIPRPTPEELDAVNAAVREFIATNDSPAAPLLKKYESLLLLQRPTLNVAATFTQTFQRRGPRHEEFVERARQGNIDLLLHGDSITDWWVQDEENTALFEKYFGAYRTANFAIAGDTTQGVLWGLRNGEGQGFQPRAVMLMIGTNNAGGFTGPEIAEGVGAVVLELRRNFPDAKILLLAIFPRSVPGDPVRDKLAEANRLIARLDDREHVFFMDIGDRFLDESGRFLPDVFRPDNLHPAAKGYDIWGAAVSPILDEWLK